ncbi:tRNA-uridine aminocarboxypropyltransferase [Simiduia curdlanivorans]|uniref:tRNA-uridine aminocarboxypropyltransferase n=1 Tax=Simiduia curdlanivorans TaxID=1492769 RepID=A0ABV8V3W5_9GAMM|nr:tRNA-uridine aminocarboxypropyltransferase [Simiduia curdlanivorans]MDN3640886.1 tRNA-uridine aminocarboxypropyltransferase [Simiduia curdlanivorans]
MNIVLLCHERELLKPSNTGQLLHQCSGICARSVTWARKAPDLELLEAIAASRAYLVYPLLGASGQKLRCLEESEQRNTDNKLSVLLVENPVIVLIDATWQQAQKMFNQSPYLQHIPRLELSRERPSLFRLRRNQKKAGLCTVECAIELLRLCGERSVADQLEATFIHFMSLPRIASQAD